MRFKTPVIAYIHTDELYKIILCMCNKGKATQDLYFSYISADIF